MIIEVPSTYIFVVARSKINNKNATNRFLQ